MTPSPQTNNQQIDFSYQPIGGLNTADNEISLQNGEVVDVQNMLMERQQLLSSPGVSVLACGAMSSAPGWAKSVKVPGGPFTLLLANNGIDIYKLNTITGAVTQITGALATIFGNYPWLASVNGVVLMSNNAQGMVRWDTPGSVYTVMTAAKYKYVAAHTQRAVAAYALTGTNPSITVAYSAEGDETNWTAPAGGLTILSDSVDEITGLGTLRNIIVIPHITGFHLGFPTGVGGTPYRWELFGRDGPGFLYPDTIAFDQDIVYGLGADNVYSFDLQQMVPIGDKVSNAIQKCLRSGQSFWGYVSRFIELSNTPTVTRVRYHLINTVNSGNSFVYDVTDKTWTKLSIAASKAFAFNFMPSAFSAQPAYVTPNTSPFVAYWAPLVPPADAQFVVFPVMSFGDPATDVTVRRILLRVRDLGVLNATVTLTYKLNNTNKTSGAITVPVGSATSDKAWIRVWADMRQTGQNFQLRIDIPANQKFSMDWVGFDVSESGGYRGA